MTGSGMGRWVGGRGAAVAAVGLGVLVGVCCGAGEAEAASRTFLDVVREAQREAPLLTGGRGVLRPGWEALVAAVTAGVAIVAGRRRSAVGPNFSAS